MLTAPEVVYLRPRITTFMKARPKTLEVLGVYYRCNLKKCWYSRVPILKAPSFLVHLHPQGLEKITAKL